LGLFEFPILSSHLLPGAGISAAVGGCRDLEFVLWLVVDFDSGFKVSGRVDEAAAGRSTL
jgi:hypothetical protein